MKYFLKSFFIVALLLNTFILSSKVYAESGYVEGTSCPKPPSDDYISICGVVTQSMPVEKTLSDGSIATVAGEGAAGVSVYIYNGSNIGPTPLINGSLVNIFSSAVTTEDGRFHIIAKKLDSPVMLDFYNEVTGEIEQVPVPKQTKMRFLVFRCGNIFAGMEIVPSYYNLTDMVKEVSCPNPGLTYTIPPETLNFVNDYQELSNQMGIEGHDDTQYSMQTYFENNKPGGEINLYINLEGADPRFTVPTGAKATLVNSALKSGEDYPDKGAWWSLDCLKKYGGDGEDEGEVWAKLCAANEDGTPIQLDEYENNLYTKPEFTVQHFLPNIPPTDAILFYKELTARQDLTEYVQDPSDVARFLGSQFSNCVGQVFLRHVGESKDQEYPDCEIFKNCNETISSGDDYRNTYTTNGPAAAFVSPTDYTTLKEQIDTEIPVCTIDGDEGNPVKIGEIQPPYDLNPGNYRLDYRYWNSAQFLVYSNQEYSGVAKLGFKIKTNATSLYEGEDQCSEIPFAAGFEGAGVPSANCTSITITEGGKGRNNSLYAASIISSGDSSVGAITNWLSAPFKDDDYRREILSSVGTFYSFTGGLRKMGEYSKINPAVDKEITTPKDDSLVAINSMFNQNDNANKNHWPFQDIGAASALSTIFWKIFGVTDEGAKQYAEYMGWLVSEDGYVTVIINNVAKVYSLKDFKVEFKDEIIAYLLSQLNISQEGQRTPHSAVYVTTAAKNRIESLNSKLEDPLLGNLKRKDALDSVLSTIYGTNDDQQVDWVKGKEVFAEQNSFLQTVIDILTGANKNKKTFLDRRNVTAAFDNMEMIDSLTVKGFAVNESNFKSLFPLPTPGSSLTVDQWGKDAACYPWNEMKGDEECGTYSEEPNSGGISRTCKVECKRASVATTCMCKRTFNTETNKYEYRVDCPNSINTDMSITNTEEPCGASTTSGEHDVKLKCARDQRSYNTPDAIIDLLESVDYDVNITPSEDCSASNFENHPDDDSVPIGANALKIPYCDVYRAGPNTCDGNLFQNSEVKTNQQVARPEQDSVKVDTVTESDVEFMKSFRSPNAVNLINLPGGFTTVKTSIGENAGFDFTERKVIRGPGAANDSVIRRMFAAPTTFGAQANYGNVTYHCNNNLLGSSGLWDCNPPPLPDPEIVDIASLKVSNKCDINYKNPKCIELVLGPQYDEFSPTFLKIVDAAATRFDIPAPIILSYMMALKVEGEQVNFSYSRYWSPQGEDDLYNISAPWYGGFTFEPSCSDMVETDQGPYDWLLKWFGDALETEGAGDALEELSIGRRSTASRCNFLDSTYAVAAVLGDGTKCEDWTWAKAKEALEVLTFGNDPKGKYLTSSKYEVGGYANQVYEACK